MITPELTQINSPDLNTSPDLSVNNSPDLNQITELIKDFSDDELDEFIGELSQLTGQKEINDKVNQNPSYTDLFKEGMQESTGNLLTQEIPGFKQIYEYADIAPMPTFKEEMARNERDLGFLQNLSKGAGVMLGDIPAMFVGGLVGGLAGAELGPGALITGGAGTFALPTLLKSSHQEYQKFFDENPEAKPTFGEYLEAAGNVSKETGKSAVIGGATAMVAPLVKILSKVPGFKTLLGSTATRKVAENVGEAATITTGTAAFQGEWPDADQFASNLLLLAGFHGTKAGARKFGEWARGKGLTQSEAVEILDNLNEEQMRAFDAAESIDDVVKQIEQKPKEIETSDKPKEIELKEPDKGELFEEFPDKPKKDPNELKVIEPDKTPKESKEVVIGAVDGKVSKVSKSIPTDFSSKKVITEPKVSKDRGMVETRGKGRIFHGSTGEIESLYEGHYAIQNIYGQGLYTTDAVDIARGYANKKRRPGFIYEIEEKPGLKFFDMEVPLKDLPKDLQKDIDSAVSDFTGISENDSLRDVYDEMREQQASADTIQEYLYAIQNNIEDRGYDGYSHRGGLITNNPEHAVKIYFSPHKSVNLNKIDPSEFTSTTKKVRKASNKIAPVSTEIEALRKKVGDLKRNIDAARSELKKVIKEKDPSRYYEKEILRSIVSKVYKELEAAKKELAKSEKEFSSKFKKPPAAPPPPPPPPPPANITVISPGEEPPPGNLVPVENGKVVEFKDVVVEEPVRDATYYENLSKKISKLISRINKFWNVEAPFKEVGGDETGRKAKLYYNTIEKHQRDAIDAIKTINDLKYDRRDRGILTLLSEAKELPEKYREKYGAGYDLIRKYFDESFEQLKEVDALIKPFPESLISRIEKENEEITKNMLKAKGKKAKANLFKKRQKNLKAINNLKDSAFVHIPYGEWFTDQYGSGEAGQRIINAINSLTNKQRKTFHIRDLLKSGAIKAEQIDIADIIGSYGLRKGKDLAIYGLMKNAVKEGLASRKRMKNYEKIPKWASNVANQFYVHPVVYDYLIPILKREPSSLNNLLGKVKGWQFYNPLFLPGYDLFQAAMLGSFNIVKPLQTGRYFVKAAKDIYYRSKDYHEAMELGLASSPFNITKSEYRELIKQAKQTLPENILDWMTPKILGKIYNLSSNLAWQGDRWIRMASYNRLIELGHSPQDAAEIAATFHADYASVPAMSRRKLNLVFFTPTFKVAMGKLFKTMAKSSFNVGKSVLKGEEINEKDKIYAQGLVNAVVISGAMDLFFTSNGFTRDIFAYRYSKPVKTEDGEDKEIVVVMPSPINLPIKYIGRAYQSFTDPGEINAWSKFARQMSWEIHPIWRLAYNLISNTSESGRPITDIIANTPGERFFDRTKYMINSIMPWTQLSEIDEESEKSREQMEKEIGQVFGLMFRPFTNHYIRDSFEKRTVGKIKRLVDALATRQIRAAFDPKTDPLTEEQVERYSNQIQKVVTQLDEHRQNKEK